MVQLEILSGETAGTRWAARRFPVRIGRSPEADLRLQAAGVWDEHAEISLDPTVGFVLQTQPNALTMTNGKPAQRVVLRNGDRIDLGAAALRFWLAEARQRSLGIRESACWLILAAVGLGQIALIYWLVRL